jgi:hypothetical protein
MARKMATKTRYCLYWIECDREEDCKAGEYCPVYRYNDDLVDNSSYFDGGDIFRDLIDKKWRE